MKANSWSVREWTPPSERRPMKWRVWSAKASEMYLW